MARNAAAHAGRTLVVFAIGIAVIFGLVAIGGSWKPALGLDLQGGTRITLTANGNPSQENLDEAASIIDSRVNATGFSEAEVTTQGSQYIVVEVPGDTDNSLLDTVNRQAQLRFRTVACASDAPGPCASATPVGSSPIRSPWACPWACRTTSRRAKQTWTGRPAASDVYKRQRRTWTRPPRSSTAGSTPPASARRR